MASDRPTFHESWYRVNALMPQLRATVQIIRQDWRGRVWYVLEDPSGNQYFRISREAYHFIGLLNGQRTVDQAWQVVCEHCGDSAPTQGEVIQLLGQLYTSNLLRGQVAPDAEGLFHRYRKRVRKELGGYLMNLLFPRIPLWDPDRFLQRWVVIAGQVFSPVGVVLWAVLIGVGFYFLMGRWEDLLAGASPQRMLATGNLLWLYLTFAVIKAMHELGHGFACKRFGQPFKGLGQVHTIGLMFLVFVPVPYVDASSAWLIPGRWQRMVVGAAGMYVELALAAIAAIIWAHTGSDTTLHAIAYNAMFIASVSTLLFNGNPLLRYDGYYILSDLLQIPNLAQHCKQFFYYLAKKYAFGVRHPMDPSHGAVERVWLIIYGITSSIYRVFIFALIIWYVSSVFFVIGLLFAVAALIGYVGVPLGRFVHYLTVGPELSRTRGRAAWVTAGGVALFAIVVGLIPVPDHARAMGIVKPVIQANLYAKASGFLNAARPSGAWVQAEHKPLVVAHNQLLQSRLATQRANLELVTARYHLAQTREVALAQALAHQIHAIDVRIDELQSRLSDLHLYAPIPGRWVANKLDRLDGAFITRGQRVGTIVQTTPVVVDAVASQWLGPRLEDEVGCGGVVEMRADGCPARTFKGKIQTILPAGQSQLLAPALALTAGGTIEVQPEKTRQGALLAAEPFFKIKITPLRSLPQAAPHAGHTGDSNSAVALLPGRRVIVRFTLPSRPVAVQLWLAIHQLIQERF